MSKLLKIKHHITKTRHQLHPKRIKNKVRVGGAADYRTWQRQYFSDGRDGKCRHHRQTQRGRTEGIHAKAAAVNWSTVEGPPPRLRGTAKPPSQMLIVPALSLKVTSSSCHGGGSGGSAACNATWVVAGAGLLRWVFPPMSFFPRRPSIYSTHSIIIQCAFYRLSAPSARP